jgi:hypothetical protein
MSLLRRISAYGAIIPLAISLMGVSAKADIVGSIFLTGHDPDFHAFAGGNSTGAAHINVDAIKFVTDPTFNTFANAGIKKFLYVTSSVAPPGGHVDGTNGLLTSGYVLGTDFDRADASTLPTTPLWLPLISAVF